MTEPNLEPEIEHALKRGVLSVLVGKTKPTQYDPYTSRNITGIKQAGRISRNVPVVSYTFVTNSLDSAGYVKTDGRMVSITEKGRKELDTLNGKNVPLTFERLKKNGNALRKEVVKYLRNMVIKGLEENPPQRYRQEEIAVILTNRWGPLAPNDGRRGNVYGSLIFSAKLTKDSEGFYELVKSKPRKKATPKPVVKKATEKAQTPKKAPTLEWTYDKELGDLLVRVDIGTWRQPTPEEQTFIAQGGGIEYDAKTKTIAVRAPKGWTVRLIGLFLIIFTASALLYSLVSQEGFVRMINSF